MILQIFFCLLIYHTYSFTATSEETQIETDTALLYYCCQQGDMLQAKIILETHTFEQKKQLIRSQHEDTLDTPLHAATQHGNHTLVKFLLQQIDHVDLKNRCHVTPLYTAAFYGQESIVQLLIKHNTVVNALTISHATPLHKAALMDHPNIVAFLLAQGADPDILDDTDETAYDIAIKYNNINIANILRSWMNQKTHNAPQLHSSSPFHNPIPLNNSI